MYLVVISRIHGQGPWHIPPALVMDQHLREVGPESGWDDVQNDHEDNAEKFVFVRTNPASGETIARVYSCRQFEQYLQNVSH